MNKIITFLLIAMLLAPPFAVAQEAAPAPEPTPAPTPVEDTAIASTSETVAPSPETSEVTISQSADSSITQQSDVPTDPNASPQSADRNQVSADDSAVESTFDPHDTTTGSTTPIIVPNEPGDSDTIPLPPPDTSTTTPVATSTPPDTSDPAATSTPPIPADSGATLPPSDPTPTVADEPPPPNVVTITQIMEDPSLQAVAQLKETKADKYTIAVQEKLDSKYAFTVKGSIAANETPDWQGGDKDRVSKKVTATPLISADNVEGVLRVSGICSAKYFVIILYSNKEDYNVNPASYILNKAFDCVAGRYDYSIKDLPNTLADGTYYLLVASQGDTGPWTPITALVPINIKRD